MVAESPRDCVFARASCSAPLQSGRARLTPGPAPVSRDSDQEPTHPSPSCFRAR